MKYLSSRFLIIFLQETWLYRYQTSILADIFDNTEFACGCVDDDAPVPPSLHMRGLGGTCILWHSSLNSLIKKLPKTSARINVVELKCPMTLFCLVNVYLPAQGVAENETLFAECLDELHEIFIKYSPTHTIVFGGDFNASLHRGDHLRRDVLVQEFVIEHGLQPDPCYPTRDIFFHLSSDSSSQIDYFLVVPSGMRLQSTVTIPEIHHLNLSNHTNLEIRINTVAPRGQASSEKSSKSKCVLHSRIKWNKYDLSLYKAVVSESLASGSSEVECSLDPELIVRSITSTLRKASLRHLVLSQRKGSRRKGSLFGVMESLQLFMGVR